MTLLTTLPGDIPSILLLGSILRIDDRRAVVVEEPEGDAILIAIETDDGAEIRVEQRHAVALDLTHPASRQAAALWASGLRLNTSERALVITAALSIFATSPWSEQDTDALARLVLRLAGRTP